MLSWVGKTTGKGMVGYGMNKNKLRGEKATIIDPKNLLYCDQGLIHECNT